MSPSISFPLLRAQSDARLVALAREGHERAFEALVLRYRRPLLAYCRRLLLPEARAEDALQQALMKAWMALRDGSEVREPKAWLYRIVHNTAVSALRRSGYDYVELDESLRGADAPESDLERRIAVREALAGLAALPDAQREVLLRTAVQGESHEQVAASLGLSEGAVRGLVYRARASLRTAVTAVTPAQLVLWAARAAESGSHLQPAELAGGAGSAGMLGLLLKGGAVVVSAGVLATGSGLVARGGSSVSPASADSALRPHDASASLDPPAIGPGLAPLDRRERGGEDGRAERRGRGGEHSGGDRSGRDSSGDGGSGEDRSGDGGGGGGPGPSDRRDAASGGSGRDGGGSDGGATTSGSGGTSGSGDQTSSTSGKDSSSSSGSGSGSSDGGGLSGSDGSSGSGDGLVAPAPATLEEPAPAPSSGGGPGPSGEAVSSTDGGGDPSTSGSGR